MNKVKNTLTILAALSIIQVLDNLKFKAAAQTPVKANRINIPNCNESFIDSLGEERCQICQGGFTKSFDMTTCQLATVKGCVWISPYGCIECQCGYVVQNDLKGCLEQKIEGCLRLDSSGSGCIQPKLGYTIVYSDAGGKFQYLSMKQDIGSYCGWQKTGDTLCTMCQPGFFLETGGKSCKKLTKRLQNEQFMWLNSNVISDPTTVFQLIPGWESWVGKTNAGLFENLIPGCAEYVDTGDQYNNIPLCKKCVKGKIITQNKKECVLGSEFCEYADDEKKYCIKCVNDLDYWADSITNSCIVRNQMFDNCKTRDPAKDECVLCNDDAGYKLDNTKKCVYISDCKKSDGLVDCVECNQSFQLGGTPKTCTKLKINCKVQDNAMNCLTCEDGYYEWNGDCYLKTPNCDVVDKTSSTQSDHFCSTCITGYHKVDTNCYQDIEFCVQHFTTVKDGCEQCLTMYTPSVDGLQCLLHNLQFQKYCQKTDGKGNCQQCISLKFIPHCLDITNSNLCLVSNGKDDKCIQCLPNALLNNSICQEVDSTCLRTNGNDKCLQCKMGYYIDASTFRCLQVSLCSVSNGVDNKCLACNDGVILNNDKCEVKSAGCSIEIYNGSTKNCIQCLTGYKLSGATCTQITDCVETNGTDDICYQCITDKQYDKVNNKCDRFDPNPIYKPPLFCNIFYKNPIAKLLYDGPDTACIKLFPNQIFYDFDPNYGLCMQCQTPRVLRWRLDTGNCLTATKLIQECVELSAIGTVIDNCKIYDYRPGICRLCENNYTLNANGYCVPNIQEYCKYTIDTFGYKDSNKCQVCMDGVYYESSAQKCKLTVQNCKNYSATGCSSCQDNFYFKDNKICIPYAGQQCSAWNSDFSSCTTCKSGFEYTLASNPNICLYNPYKLDCSSILNNQCVACTASKILVRDNLNNPNCLTLSDHPDPQCIEYNSSGVCSKCAANKVLKRSLNNKIYLECVDKDPDCTSVDSATSTCSACNSPKYVDKTYTSAGCIQIDKCVDPLPAASDGTGCKKCDKTQGYYLSEPFKCSLLENCITTVDGISPTCYQCKKDYYPYIGGSCILLNMKGCIDNDGYDATCKTCDDTYYLDSKVCKKGNVKNCLKYDPTGAPTNGDKCALCNSGFTLDANFKCNEIPNCEQSDGSSTTCTKCKPYFYQKSPTECAPPDNMIVYCSRYKPDQSCESCEIAYYMSGGACVKRSTRYDYCKLYYFTSNTCFQCQNKGIGGVKVIDEHSEKKGFCNPISIDKCDIYQQNAPKCSICNQDTDFADGWLVPSSNYCKDVSTSKCLTLNPQGTKCTSCQQGVNFYYKEKGVCLKLCTNGYQTGDPLTCTTYTASKVANCDIPDPLKDECQICAKSYVKNSTTKICEKMTVTNCADNGKLRGQQCFECEQRYLLSNNTCTVQPTIPNCDTYVKNTGICGLCSKGYYLGKDGLSCIAISAGANCKDNSIDSDVCLICQDNTFTISKDGKACFTGRATSKCLVSVSSSPSSQCFICESGYIPVTNSKDCIQDDFNLPGCTAVSKLSGNSYYTCSECKSNYNLQNNICIPSQGLSTCGVENCDQYSSYLYDSAKCNKCKAISGSNDSYLLQNNQCVFVQSAAHLSFILSLFSIIIISIF